MFVVKVIPTCHISENKHPAMSYSKHPINCGLKMIRVCHPPPLIERRGWQADEKVGPGGTAIKYRSAWPDWDRLDKYERHDRCYDVEVRGNAPGNKKISVLGCVHEWWHISGCSWKMPETSWALSFCSTCSDFIHTMCSSSYHYAHSKKKQSIIYL